MNREKPPLIIKTSVRSSIYQSFNTSIFLFLFLPLRTPAVKTYRVKTIQLVSQVSQSRDIDAPKSLKRECISHSCNHYRCRVFLLFPIFLDIDECQKNTHDCHLKATCQNTNGSFVCICLFGLNGDGRNCTGKDL